MDFPAPCPTAGRFEPVSASAAALLRGDRSEFSSSSAWLRSGVIVRLLCAARFHSPLLSLLRLAGRFCLRVSRACAEERTFPRMAPPGAAAASAAASTMKETARAYRWMKAIAAATSRGSSAMQPQGQAKVVPVQPTPELPQSHKVEFTGRYTNFSLNHVWERYDYLQTHLLLQEALLLQQGQNPALLEPERELHLRPMVEVSLEKSTSSPLDDPTEAASPRRGKGQ